MASAPAGSVDLFGKFAPLFPPHQTSLHQHFSVFFSPQWDFNVNLQTFQCAENAKKKTCPYASRTRRIEDTDDDSEDESPPLRRSRRIAELRRAQSNYD